MAELQNIHARRDKSSAEKNGASRGQKETFSSNIENRIRDDSASSS